MATILTATEIISGNNSISFPNSSLLSLTAGKIESDTGASILSNTSSSLNLLGGSIASDTGVSFFPNSVADGLTVSGSVLGFVPGPPTGVTTVAGDGVVTVRFTPPAAKNGSEIVSYTVTPDPNPDNVQVTRPKADAEANGIVVSNLLTNRPYTFTVQATNGTGLGVASQPSASITPTLARVFAVQSILDNYFGDVIPITVWMNIVVYSDTTVQLSTSAPEVFTNLPSSVTIPAGERKVKVMVPTVSNLVTYRVVPITAAYNSSSATFNMIVKATDLVAVGTANDQYQFYAGSDIQLNFQLDNAQLFGAGSLALTYSDASLLQGTIPSTVSFAANSYLFSTTLKASSNVLTPSKLVITVTFGDAVKTREIQIVPSV
jgi:hypothetical protein